MNDLLKKWDTLSEEVRRGVMACLWDLSRTRYRAAQIADFSKGDESRAQFIEDICEGLATAAMIFEAIELTRGQ